MNKKSSNKIREKTPPCHTVWHTHTHNEGATPGNHPQKPPAFESQKKSIEQQQQQHELKSNMATICQSAREQREKPRGSNNNNNTLRTLGKNCTWNFYLAWQKGAWWGGRGWASSGAQNFYLKRKKTPPPFQDKRLREGSLRRQRWRNASSSDSSSDRECHRSLSLSLSLSLTHSLAVSN